MSALTEISKRLRVPPGRRFSLKRHDPKWTGGLRDKDRARRWLEAGVRELAEHQERLYAHDTHALLLIFQAMDAAGKDSTIRHVMSGVNPLGCQVFNFKVPSAEERDHDYLWRSVKALPERGRIGIHNRSYYEEVLVARVHPEILAAQQLPQPLKPRTIWKRRFDAINHFERHLVDNGTVVVKFFLNVSKDTQKKRFLERIDDPKKNWKFSVGDVRERALWRHYMAAYEACLTHTSTPWAPWYVVPADHKWFTRLAVSGIVNETMRGLPLALPPIGDERKGELEEARRMLLEE